MFVKIELWVGTAGLSPTADAPWTRTVCKEGKWGGGK